MTFPRVIQGCFCRDFQDSLLLDNNNLPATLKAPKFDVILFFHMTLASASHS